jgi:hypothetical protein
VCEPLLTHRKIKDDVETRAGPGPGTKVRALGCVPSAGERPVSGPGGVRCIGGVSSSQALAGKGRTCRLDAGGPVAAAWSPEGRTPSGRNREGQSTDARHRGGPARSSDEGPVMGLEPRGRASQVVQMPTLRGMS